MKRKWKDRKATVTSITSQETLLFDAGKARRTSQGYLVTDAKVARTGVQKYHGVELGRPDLEMVRVYRPPEEVFDRGALRSFAHVPLTNDHPSEFVDAKNWKKLAVGQVGDEVVRDGEFIRVPLVLMDADTIDLVNQGKRELSVGYSSEIIWTDGVTEGGEQFDAVQTNIRANHVAVVSVARGGNQLRIGDHKGVKPMNMTTIVVDGISCQMTDTAAEVVQRALKAMDAKVKAKEEEAEEEKKKKTKDAASLDEVKSTLAAAQAENAVLKKQVEDSKMTPDRLDQLVRDRSETIGKSKTLLGDSLEITGKTDHEIRKQVVDAMMGDASKGWDEKETLAAFNALTATAAKGDGTVTNAGPAIPGNNASALGQSVLDAARALSGRAVQQEDIYADYTKRITDAWKTLEPGKPAA